MKKILTVCIFVLVGVLIVGVLPTHGEAAIYSSVVRLHVLANSDSDGDQALKLKVRDAVLSLASELTAGCNTRAQALEILSGSLDEIRLAAEEVIKSEGYDYPVEVKLGEEEYPEKSYESVCFPAGTYMSLRVCIGEAEGHNWWCVLFPNLCLSAAGKSQAEDAFVAAGLTPDQYKIVTESDGAKYRIRFKFLEIIENGIGQKNKG